LEKEVVKEQAALEEEEVDEEGASDESESENDNKVHNQFCKAKYHSVMRKRKLRNIASCKLTPDNQASLDKFMETKLGALNNETPNEAGELFKCETGLAICIVCHNKHVTWKTLARHIGTKKHMNQKAAHTSAAETVQMQLQNFCEHQHMNAVQGQTVSNNATNFCAQVLDMFCG
jgi:hypothetical protein